ncbi:MAG: ABC transporter permease [Bdellovibrionales bacterium]|nr:ABC transporter permease [Bdellovibrionales bacterium]
MDEMLSLLGSTLRLSAPLIFAAMGGLLSERSGVIHIALEGMMMVGGFAAAVATLSFHSPLVGCAAAVIAGLAFSALYAALVIPFRANQVVAGTAINFLAAGVVPSVSKLLYGNTGSTPSIPLDERLHWAGPVVGAIVLVAGLALLLAKTPVGLWIRFAGEHPHALASAGVNVIRVRFLSVLAAGALAAMGGATLSLSLSSAYSRNMTAARGFMALAALIFGKWKAWPAFAACLLFGFAEALQNRLQGVALPWKPDETIPVQFIQMLPYLVTLVVLAGFVGRSRAPKALGTQF